MEEYLSFNSLGQWTLNKSVDPTTRDFNAYHKPNDSFLHVNWNLRGKVANNVNSKYTSHMSQEKMDRKMPTPKISQYQSRNPSLEDDSASPNIDRL